MDERLEHNLSIAPNAIKAHKFLDFKWKEELIVGVLYTKNI